MSKPRHIGIVAASPEGSSLCYREVNRCAIRLVGDTGHPRITLHNEPLEDYLSAVERDDWHHVGELLARSASALQACGAEFCIMPDNLLQHGVHMAEPRSPIPWLNMAELVAQQVAAAGHKTVGLIGTRQVMFGSTYQTLLGIRGVKVIAPEAADAEMFNAIIFGELVHGEVTAASQTKWVQAIGRLQARGADGVILGCTEAPLLIGAAQSPLPVYDSTAILAEAAARHALRL
ncbi:MAG: amino acid racemase [Phycisphaeraceae bacterium]|jgi:aspartate racemase|nr:amino acid racemase [Phycisphaeraceae bacterium]